MILLHLTSVTLGFYFDRIIGDPVGWPHPVRWIGTWIRILTKRLNGGNYRTLKGAILLLLTVVPVLMIVGGISYIAYTIHPLLYALAEALLIAIALAQKSLKVAARDVAIPLSAGDLQEAREKLSWIVGRDTEQLCESEITRGVVETVSENISDGVTAPLFFAFLFGAPGIWLYKSVNTLDSMVGYKDERYKHFGTASARADDVLNFIPARLTGLLIVLGSPNRGRIPLRYRFKGWLRDAKKHPSPNSGYLEAATAWQLGVKLGGTNTYRGKLSHRPTFGPGVQPLTASHIDETLTQLSRASWGVWALGILIGGIFYGLT